MIWVWTLICTAAVVGSCVLLGLVERGARKRRLLAAPGGIGCDAPEEFGISVLCCGTCDAEQIAALMSEECARYEVVVAIDALRRPAEFEALAARYCMTRVEWRGSDELPVSGIRAVGRSRKRRYRRLVLVDRAQGTPEGDLNAAAAVATYDYLLPLDCGQRLLPDAVARLVAELGGEPAGRLALIGTRIGVPAMLVSREAVIAAGGFTPRLAGSIPRRQRRWLWEPLVRTAGAPRRRPGWVWPVAGLGAAAVAAAAGAWTAASACAAAAAVCGAWACAAQTVREMAGGHPMPLFGRSVRRWKLSVKNFTVW